MLREGAGAVAVAPRAPTAIETFSAPDELNVTRGAGTSTSMVGTEAGPLAVARPAGAATAAARLGVGAVAVTPATGWSIVMATPAAAEANASAAGGK